MQTITAIYADTIQWTAFDSTEVEALAQYRAAVGGGDDDALTYVTVTADQVAALRDEAAIAGDAEMARLCDAALDGDDLAAADVVQAIDDACAMADD